MVKRKQRDGKASKKAAQKSSRKKTRVPDTPAQTIDQHPRPSPHGPQSAAAMPTGIALDQHPRPMHQAEAHMSAPQGRHAARRLAGHPVPAP